ncbi:MAG: hypothetical protein ACKPJD_00065, partial [Planctomycetaceae bacterium]
MQIALTHEISRSANAPLPHAFGCRNIATMATVVRPDKYAFAIGQLQCIGPQPQLQRRCKVSTIGQPRSCDSIGF